MLIIKPTRLSSLLQRVARSYNINVLKASFSMHVFIRSVQARETISQNMYLFYYYFTRIVGSIPSRRLWSCIFRNRSQLGLKMYIFLTLEFILYLRKIYLLTTSVNAKYYLFIQCLAKVLAPLEFSWFLLIYFMLKHYVEPESI